MKKTGLVLGILAAMVLTGCTQEEQKEEIANPMEEVESARAFVKLGANIEVPAGAQDAKYYIVNEEIAEIQFTFNDAAYSYRASRTAEDISGVKENTVEGRELEIEAGGEEITIETLEEGGRLAEWDFDPVEYSLYTGDEVEDAVVQSLVRELVNETSAQPAGNGGKLTANIVFEPFL